MSNVLARFSVTLILCVYSGAMLAARFDFDATPGRLSKDVVPTHYRLDFDLDPGRDTFSGHVVIDLTVRRAAAEIVLQATELAARRALLVSKSGEKRELTVTPDEAHSLWRLGWKGESLAPGKWQLHIDYEGKVERRGQGLYRVDYRAGSRSDSPQQMLATQLEPTNARAVFPSFDEPAFRATFDIAITAPSGFESVSNMPVASQVPLLDGRRRTEFSRTPAMPTYLVALAVGDFDALTGSFDGIPLRILTARGRSHEAVYAMEVTKQVLGYYRDYFDTPYMLPKLDQLAIPGVRGGAMEDWGAISYNENLLLFDATRSAPRQKQTIFNLVAHEIAHQWFGNLVTAAWWDDIWLNEAFATWMAAKAQHHFNPALGIRVRARLYREEALQLDGGSATRAVADPPSHESAIFDVFDEITYNKGGAVLGMFEAQLGEAAFRDGLRKYIAAHRYSNATADDLWFHLSQAAGRDIAPLISGWIKQRGFPLLIVRANCIGNRTSVDISQQRFMARQTQQIVTSWQVPVVINGGKQSKRLVLGREPERVDFAGCVPVVANGDDIGYYRVNYDTANMRRLRAAYGRLPATERIGLVADTMALARAGRIEFAEYFQLLEAARAEYEAAVWQQVIEGLTYLDSTFAGTPAQAEVRAYGRSLLGPVLQRVSWQPRAGEDAGTLRLRNSVIDALGLLDDAETRKRANALFLASVTAPATPIDPSIRSGVIRTAARYADATTFETLRRLLRDATNQEDNYLFGGALICVRDPRLVYKALELTLTDEWPPGSASWYARNIGAASGHPRLARDFAVKHFDALQSKTPRARRPWLLPDVYEGFNDSRDSDDLVATQLSLLGKEASAPAEQIAEAIREKAAVREREQAQLQAVLRRLAARQQTGDHRSARD